MQIIIPLTGNGSRFKAQDFDRLKPFIEVHGTPMIEWVVRMFDEAPKNFTFVVREEHIQTLPYMRPELERISPGARIVPILDWVKKGPVYDIWSIAQYIDDAEPVLVSYCDFYMHWNYAAFVAKVTARKCDGAVPCYSGFHPNLVPPQNLYASCKVDESDNLIEIREKFSWTEDKTQSRHSPGVYYFRTGALMKQYFERLINSAQVINGEFYASLPYNFMAQDGLDVWCPTNVTHFCQWGTPEDLGSYLYWVERILSARGDAF